LRGRNLLRSVAKINMPPTRAGALSHASRDKALGTSLVTQAAKNTYGLEILCESDKTTREK